MAEPTTETNPGGATDGGAPDPDAETNPGGAKTGDIRAAMAASRARREALDADAAARSAADVESGADRGAVPIADDWRPPHPDVWFGPHQKPTAPHVEALQALLGQTGYLDMTVETADLKGVYGPRTQQAVENLQAAADLDANGYCDQATWDAVYILAGHEPPPARD